MKKASECTWESVVEAINNTLENDARDYKYALNLAQTETMLINDAAALNPFVRVLKGLPVVLANSGPSLTDAACSLIKNSRIPVIAVDNALHKLKANEISPFLVVTTDMSEKCADMLRGGIEKNTFVAVSPFVHKDTLAEAANGRPIIYACMSSREGSFLYKFNQKYPITQLSATGTVGTIAVSLAAFLGVEKIIFAGLDLSYSEANEVPEGKEALELENGRVTIIDYWSSKLWYEKAVIANPNGPKLIQTTLHTRLEGAEHLRLEDALANEQAGKLPNYAWALEKVWKKWADRRQKHVLGRAR